MKSQDLDHSLDETSRQIQENHSKTCLQDKTATLVCCSKYCDQIAYICGDQSCKCYNQHKKCSQILIQSILNKIKSKIIPFDHIQKTIFHKIDQTIDTLSDFKDKLQSQFKKYFNRYGLTIKDKHLFNTLNQQKITGKKVFKSFDQASHLENIFEQKESLDIKFTELWKSVDEFIIKKSNQFFNFFNFSTNGIKLFNNSKIPMGQDGQKNLVEMFEEKRLKSAKLLYRASENDSKADKFHEKCDKIPHTLTLCETVHGKVIGGYTPLIWDRNASEFVKDGAGASFIFSLTNNHKFTLKNLLQAIYQRADCGPIFGNNDFYISDSKNTLITGGCQVNQSYFNQNYTQENGDSYMKFNGNQDKSYIYQGKQWQVWQLEFQ